MVREERRVRESGAPEVQAPEHQGAEGRKIVKTLSRPNLLTETTNFMASEKCFIHTSLSIKRES